MKKEEKKEEELVEELMAAPINEPIEELVEEEEQVEESVELVENEPAEATPTLEYGPETKLQYLAPGSLFEIGGILYRLLRNDGVGVQVAKVNVVKELTMGANTLCLPCQVV